MTPRPRTGETGRRTIRVPDKVWKDAQAKADREGKNVSDVVRKCLDDYTRKRDKR